MNQDTFRLNLHSLMESRGWTTADMSIELQIPAPTLSRYLSGARIPKLPQIIKIAEYFGVSLDWLIGHGSEKYDVIPNNVRKIAELYTLATMDDRIVVDAVLNKYKPKE